MPNLPSLIDTILKISGLNDVYPFAGMNPNKSAPFPGQDSYSVAPFEKDYQKRKNTFLRYCAEKSVNSLMGSSALAASGSPIEVPDEIIQKYERRLAARLDCADFYAAHVVHALFINDRMPFLTDVQVQRLNDSLLGFKYWIDEPGPDKMITWTENHQILFHALEILAGERFQTEIFNNNGEKGEWHVSHGKNLALKWMERRARFGYFEWASNEYYEKDVAALAMLAQFSRDEEILRAASKSLDLILLDIAFNLFKGFYACTHGRAYEQEILTGRQNEVASLVKVVWGTGCFNEHGQVAALALSSGDKYAPSDAVIGIGQAEETEFLGFERHGFPLEKSAEYGYRHDDLESLPIFWEMGAYTNPEVLDLFIRAADKWNLWGHPFIDAVGDLHRFIPRNGKVGKLTRWIEIEPNRSLLGEVNKVTYKTPDYMLSSAVDYRPGERGNQHHVWQATLSPDAIVFTTNPGSLGTWGEELSPDAIDFREKGADEKTKWNRTPTYWAGQNRLPRVAQYRNVAVIIYNINPVPALGERMVFPFTHAFFPKWAFDEVVEKAGWIFGRVVDGYVALYSKMPAAFRNPDGVWAHDMIAYGLKNVWVCHTGNRSRYGGFSEFVDAVSSAKLSAGTLDVEYHAPGIGKIDFSWKGPLLVCGKRIPLSGFKRFDNPYCQLEHNSNEAVNIHFTDKRPEKQ